LIFDLLIIAVDLINNSTVSISKELRDKLARMRQKYYGENRVEPAPVGKPILVILLLVVQHRVFFSIHAVAEARPTVNYRYREQTPERYNNLAADQSRPTVRRNDEQPYTRDHNNNNNNNSKNKHNNAGPGTLSAASSSGRLKYLQSSLEEYIQPKRVAPHTASLTRLPKTDPWSTRIGSTSPRYEEENSINEFKASLLQSLNASELAQEELFPSRTLRAHILREDPYRKGKHH
jgi:hypothetical protein